MNKIRHIFLHILVVASFLSTHAQNYNALNVTREDGLSDSNVKAICVDKLGYVWFGTEHGLNRYDGFETVSYYNSINDPTTIADNNIGEIYEDFDGNIWVNTSGQLDVYERETDLFKRVKIPNATNSYIIAYEDSTYLWIKSGTNEKLWLYNKSNNKIREENIDISQVSLEPSDLSFSMVCNFSENHLLFAIAGQGLYLFSLKDKTLELFVKLSLLNWKGLQLDDENIWLGNAGGEVYKINKVSKNIIEYNSSNSELVGAMILSLKRHPLTNNIWISTDGGGIGEFDSDFNLLNHFVAGPKVNELLPANSINTIHFTKTGDVWAGTVRSGAVLLYPGNFEHFSFVDNTEAGPSSGIIVKIIEDNKKNVWLATDGGGLNKFDPDLYSFQSFSSEGLTKITGIVEFSENQLLLADYLGKLHFFDTKTQRFSDAHKHPLLKNIPLNCHYRLSNDSRGNIWIWANKLVRVNFRENTVQEFKANKYTSIFSEINPSFFTTSEDLKNNLLWFGAEGGFYAYNYETNRIEHPVIFSNSRNNFGSSVFSVCSISETKVLFGTSRGLFIYNPITRLTSRFWKDNAFENTVFQSIFQKNGNVWAATSDGLLQISPNSSSNNIVKYLVGSHDFRSSSILLSSDDKAYLGTNNGFIRLTPELVKEDTLTVPVLITSFEQRGTRKGAEFRNTVLANVKSKARAKLPFSNSLYRFNFNSFDIPNQEKINYSYLLEGFEEIWHTGKARNATYTNLSPGNYTFHVKASSTSGHWGEDSTPIEFKILPAWWQTLWFKALVVLFILAISALFWNELLKRAKLRHLMELEIKEKEKLEAMNQMKLRFFTNISHEIRTPLTLIYSPLKRMVDKDVQLDEIKNGLPGLFRNAQRMKTLVDQILEFRKAEMDELSLNLKNADFIDFCREVLDSFYFMAQTENIKLELEHEQEQLFINFDDDKFAKILYNLISNALKFTPKNGTVVVKVSANNEWINISVSDTGKGIKESELESIFERFYQINNDVGGTGIGLALSKKLVSLHEGKIWAESKFGEGATFFVQIPKVVTAENNQAEVLPEKQTTIKIADLETDTCENDLTLLIIEDDWELRQYLKTEFRNKYKIITAENGRKGLFEAIGNVPDLIITDVMMPEMNGYEFCKALRDDLRISHIPVVMLTAKNMSEHQIEGYKSGADLYVSKPFDKEILDYQISSLLRNRELLRDRFGHDLGLDAKKITNSNCDEKLLHKAISIVEMNLQNPQFDVNTFVDKLGISRTLAYKKIKSISGKSINDFILSVRLKQAATLLVQTNKSVSEIASEIGFTDHSYFSAVFKKNFEVSPSEYRQHGNLND